MVNLEALAVRIVAEMIAPYREATGLKTLENLITDALQVLSRQGLYALGLYLVLAKEHDQAESVHRAVFAMLEGSGLHNGTVHGISVDHYRELVTQRAEEDAVSALQRGVMTVKVLELLLSYGRYHARAKRQGLEA